MVHEFWLSSTITECTIDTATQTAEAKFLSKWHFVDKDFANKVKRGGRLAAAVAGGHARDAGGGSVIGAPPSTLRSPPQSDQTS